MRTVLCFGDTNTWGVNPVNEERLPYERRWTGILAEELKNEGIRIVEEGQCGRTTICDDPCDRYKNGMDYLMPCLDGHRPIDVMVIMLGTVQLKGRFNQSAEDIALGVDRVVEAVVKSNSGVHGAAPKVLLISPVEIGRVEDGPLSSTFFLENNRERQKKFKALFRSIAQRYGTEFMAAEDYAKTSELDGIHIAEESHRPFAYAVADKIREMLGRTQCPPQKNRRE